MLWPADECLDEQDKLWLCGSDFLLRDILGWALTSVAANKLTGAVRPPTGLECGAVDWQESEWLKNQQKHFLKIKLIELFTSLNPVSFGT